MRQIWYGIGLLYVLSCSVVNAAGWYADDDVVVGGRTVSRDRSGDSADRNLSTAEYKQRRYRIAYSMMESGEHVDDQNRKLLAEMGGDDPKVQAFLRGETKPSVKRRLSRAKRQADRGEAESINVDELDRMIDEAGSDDWQVQRFVSDIRKYQQVLRDLDDDPKGKQYSRNTHEILHKYGTGNNKIQAYFDWIDDELAPIREKVATGGPDKLNRYEMELLSKSMHEHDNTVWSREHDKRQGFEVGSYEPYPDGIDAVYVTGERRASVARRPAGMEPEPNSSAPAETDKQQAMRVLWDKVKSGMVDLEKLSGAALNNFIMHGPKESHGWAREELDRRDLPEETGPQRVARVMWEKVEKDEDYGRKLSEKGLDELAQFGPDEAREWVTKERKRREDAEMAELDRAAESRDRAQSKRRADKDAASAADEKEEEDGAMPPAATEYTPPAAVVDIEGDMTWASSEEGMKAGIEFPEIVEFFLRCLAKPWQQSVGIKRVINRDASKSVTYSTLLVTGEAIRSDALLARKTIKATARGFVSRRKEWTSPGDDLLPALTPIPARVFPAQKALEALYAKDPNDWTDVAQDFWKAHNRDASHKPTTLYEEAVHRWFIKTKGPKGKIRSFAPIAWYVALASGDTSNHHDPRAYKAFFTTEQIGYALGGLRTPYMIAVFNNLIRYFDSLVKKLVVDTHASKDAGTPQEKAFAAAMRTLFDKAPDGIVSIWELRNAADKAVEKIYKEDARISVDEDHQPGKNGVAWKKVAVEEETAVGLASFDDAASAKPADGDDKKAQEMMATVKEFAASAKKVRSSQQGQYPDTLKFFLSEEGKKASGWQRALALTKTATGFAVLPFNMDAAYDPLLMRKIVKHAALYLIAPEKFSEEGAPPIKKDHIHQAIGSYKALMKEYVKNRRKWSKRVFDIWDAHVADPNRFPQTYLEEAVYRWYLKTSGPGFARENAVGMTKKMPEEAFEPFAIYAALNGATVTSHDEIKYYRNPAADLRVDRYQSPRASYLHMLEHFLRSRYTRLADAVSDDIASELSAEQKAFGAGIKTVLDGLPVIGVLQLRCLVADQVVAHYSQPPKSVRKMKTAAQLALKG